MSEPRRHVQALIVMGVSGSGKTTVGQALANRLGWTFLEGDDFHPEVNVRKMEQGIPLTDADRWPWLEALRARIEQHLSQGDPCVVACSALKAAYRDVLKIDGRVRFIYLKGTYDTILARMQARDHFMPPELLASQFEALEEPEEAVVVSVEKTLKEMVAGIMDALPPRL